MYTLYDLLPLLPLLLLWCVAAAGGMMRHAAGVLKEILFSFPYVASSHVVSTASVGSELGLPLQSALGQAPPRSPRRASWSRSPNMLGHLPQRSLGDGMVVARTPCTRFVSAG